MKMEGAFRCAALWDRISRCGSRRTHRELWAREITAGSRNSPACLSRAVASIATFRFPGTPYHSCFRLCKLGEQLPLCSNAGPRHYSRSSLGQKERIHYRHTPSPYLLYSSFALGELFFSTSLRINPSRRLRHHL